MELWTWGSIRIKYSYICGIRCTSIERKKLAFQNPLLKIRDLRNSNLLGQRCISLMNYHYTWHIIFIKPVTTNNILYKTFIIHSTWWQQDYCWHCDRGQNALNPEGHISQKPWRLGLAFPRLKGACRWQGARMHRFQDRNIIQDRLNANFSL